MGGFHLGGVGLEERVSDTINDLLELRPKAILPGHCARAIWMWDLGSGYWGFAFRASRFGDSKQPSLSRIVHLQV